MLSVFLIMIMAITTNAQDSGKCVQFKWGKQWKTWPGTNTPQKETEFHFKSNCEWLVRVYWYENTNDKPVCGPMRFAKRYPLYPGQSVTRRISVHTQGAAVNYCAQAAESDHPDYGTCRGILECK